MTAVGTLLRAIGTASRNAGDLARDGRDSLRSKEHDLADQGITWPADTVYDHVLAEEVRYARQRRLAARAITLPAPTHIAPNHCTETVEPRMSNGETFVRVRGRLRVSLPSAAVGVTGQAGD